MGEIDLIMLNDSELIFCILGANDPEFNLRRDQGIILRMKDKKDAVFASVIEVHGHYDPVSEIASNAFSNLEKIEILHNDPDYTALKISDLNESSCLLILSNNNASISGKHELVINGQNIGWDGPYKLIKL